MPVKSIRMFLATTALECSAPVNHGHCQAAQRAFEELEQEFDNLPEPIPYRLTLFDVKAWPEKARELEITSLPTLLFQIDDAYVVARLLGSQINTANIKTMIRKLIMATELGEGKYDSDGVKFGNGESFKFGFGFGLFKMPKLVWPILGTLLGYKSFDSKSRYGQVGFGAGSVYCWHQYFKEDG